MGPGQCHAEILERRCRFEMSSTQEFVSGDVGSDPLGFGPLCKESGVALFRFAHGRNIAKANRTQGDGAHI